MVKKSPRPLDELKNQVDPYLETSTDKDNARFQEVVKPWADTNRQIPAAIVQRMSEEQVSQCRSALGVGGHS
ncbi:hypothetical protein DL766_009605 [Monosporascus sp. MC13-8B]|uniref:Uncharacterized protein n=1 Tax=Monosporascus cannonballus TaxID=155416 RepID=A0ABY0GRJ6_9PEZI|nr:hypothetical protein DL762_010215 [Monosporascus cannonballus]RYO85044.1 hypothetical protein DL763_007249 [Monosporascus cannonballus]RYP14670.1 hypothetical protein DL766_009605 [Monosporascus sp. MC13-8B]